MSGKSGRPTVRTPEIVDELVRSISEGMTLRETCRRLGIGWNTVYDWMGVDEELSGRIARARLLGYDAIASECVEIADDARNDWMEREGVEVLDKEHVQRSKLRIETRLKLLAKWDPKRYGERITTEHTGAVSFDADKFFADIFRKPGEPAAE